MSLHSLLYLLVTWLKHLSNSHWGKLARIITNGLIQLCNRFKNFLTNAKSKIIANFKSQYALNNAAQLLSSIHLMYLSILFLDLSGPPFCIIVDFSSPSVMVSEYVCCQGRYTLQCNVTKFFLMSFLKHNKYETQNNNNFSMCIDG